MSCPAPTLSSGKGCYCTVGRVLSHPFLWNSGSFRVSPRKLNLTKPLCKIVLKTARKLSSRGTFIFSGRLPTLWEGEESLPSPLQSQSPCKVWSNLQPCPSDWRPLPHEICLTHLCLYAQVCNNESWLRVVEQIKRSPQSHTKEISVYYSVIKEKEKKDGNPILRNTVTGDHHVPQQACVESSLICR